MDDRPSRLRVVVTLLVSVAALAWLVRQVDFAGMVDHVRAAELGAWLCALALQFATTFFMARRWQLMLARDGADPGYAWALRIYVQSTFFGLFLPSAVGGDLYRGVAAAQKLDGVRTIAVNLFAERLIGAFAVSVLGFVGLALDRALPGAVVSGVAAVCGTIVAIATMLAFAGPTRVLADLLARVRLERLAATVRGAGAQLTGHLGSGTVARLLALTFAQQLLAIAAVWACAAATGIHEVRFEFFLLVMPVVWVASLVPSLAGTGPREVSLFWFLTLAGVDDERALACTALLFATIVARALLGGAALLLPRARA